jgi:hypothetical protein
MEQEAIAGDESEFQLRFEVIPSGNTDRTAFLYRPAHMTTPGFEHRPVPQVFEHHTESTTILLRSPHMSIILVEAETRRKEASRAMKPQMLKLRRVLRAFFVEFLNVRPFHEVATSMPCNLVFTSGGALVYRFDRRKFPDFPNS